jgi:hypothetical protein
MLVNIVISDRTFTPRIAGQYMLSSVDFGEPVDQFVLRGGSQSKDGMLRASVTRHIEKDVVVLPGDNPTRKPMYVTLSITVPSVGFTAADIDAATADISTFLTADMITYLLQGGT